MRRILALISVAAVMVALTAMPALAQPVFTGGLVNVTIVDAVDVERTTVQLPIAVAANVCNVSVASLQEDPNCTARAGSLANN